MMSCVFLCVCYSAIIALSHPPPSPPPPTMYFFSFYSLSLLSPSLLPSLMSKRMEVLSKESLIEPIPLFFFGGLLNEYDRKNDIPDSNKTN